MLFSPSAWAQSQRVTLEGQVIDGESQSPIPGATIGANGDMVVTDQNGVFAIELEVGSRRIDVSAPGYLDTPVPITVRAGDNPPIEILLFSQTILSQTVEVQGQTPRPEGPSTTAVTPEEVFTVAGSIDNIYRTLDTLPGVGATEDFGSRLTVRGGATRPEPDADGRGRDPQPLSSVRHYERLQP